MNAVYVLNVFFLMVTSDNSAVRFPPGF